MIHQTEDVGTNPGWERVGVIEFRCCITKYEKFEGEER